MARKTGITIDHAALQHNLAQIKRLAPTQQIIAMVKADAYGCGIANICPIIAAEVNAFGVACIEEAKAIQGLGFKTPCMLFEGVFDTDELRYASETAMELLVHCDWQLQLVLSTPLQRPLKLWIKVETGMHRLGFDAELVPAIVSALQNCPWVDDNIGLMSHFACADIHNHPLNQQQLVTFHKIVSQCDKVLSLSMANSAAIISCREAHFDKVRPGLMLYGASPFIGTTARDYNLRPVMIFKARILCIKDCLQGDSVGYGATWVATCRSRIAIVTAGYGDGYPRHVAPGTMISIAGQKAPIVGRISMDMMTVDISRCLNVDVDSAVELWGNHIPIEYVATQATTIPYELMCQFKARPPFFL